MAAGTPRVYSDGTDEFTGTVTINYSNGTQVVNPLSPVEIQQLQVRKHSEASYQRQRVATAVEALQRRARKDDETGDTFEESGLNFQRLAEAVLEEPEPDPDTGKTAQLRAAEYTQRAEALLAKAKAARESAAAARQQAAEAKRQSDEDYVRHTGFSPPPWPS